MTAQLSYAEGFDLYNAWRGYLKSWNWQWLATLTFTPRTNYFYALRRARNWIARIEEQESIIIGASLLSSTRRGHLHFHLLMLGFDTSEKTLFDCSIRRAETSWYNHARIRVVESQEAACNYVASHWLPSKSDYCHTEMYNSDILQLLQDEGEIFYESI